VGVFFPRRACGRASDTPVATSQLHPQRFIELPRRCLFLFLRHSPAFLRVGVDRRMWRLPSPPIAPSRESRRLVFGLGCLLSLGTLHRIRWPLQPRSRDPLTAFGDGRTAKWHSRATLGLRPDLLPYAWSEAGYPDILSLAAPDRRFHLLPFTSS
jgi:hypothetical protein